MEKETKIGVEAVLELSGIDREAKAYAFLYAAFKRTEISSNPVRDALDCLTPFIAPFLNTISGTQVSVEGIQQYLKSNFGFNIPIYAIEQLMPALQKAGYVEFSSTVRAYIAKKHESQFDLVKSEIETEFDEVVLGLTSYAKSLAFTADPPSGGWGEALIAFLKTRNERPGTKVVNVKGVLLQPGKVESAIIGAYVAKLHDESPPAFAKLLKIFMGVLVEEFISSMSEIGGMDLKHPVHVLYDTAVLLRLLGCSGKLLKTATDELTRYLQDLGFKIYYFSGNEAEVAGILDTIIHKKDSGQELEGETAAAISMGEVQMAELRMLQNSFTERLALKNVFSGDTLVTNPVEHAKYQIDERGFAEYLKRKAIENGRAYGIHNRENDAKYLGEIMRLRKRMNTKDLVACGYIFVTSNKFLAQMSRRYLIEQDVIQPQHCPPMLSVGQVATIAWLMKDQTLEPQKAGRELLSNCFAVVRPDQEWFKYFREGIEKITGNIDEYLGEPRNALTLQAARRIAQEESFGDSALVRALNMVEILNRAEQENQKLLEQRDTQAALLAENMAVQHGRAVEAAATEAKQAERNLRKIERQNFCRRTADKIVYKTKVVVIILFVITIVANLYLQAQGKPSLILWVLSAILAIENVLAFMESIGVRSGTTVFDRARSGIARALEQFLELTEGPKE